MPTSAKTQDAVREAVARSIHRSMTDRDDLWPDMSAADREGWLDAADDALRVIASPPPEGTADV